MLLGGRRSPSHFLRWIYAGWLIVQLPFFMITTRSWQRSPEANFVDFAGAFLQGFLLQHFAILILLTPAFVAGAISDEKVRGTLQYLLTADLRPGEIVLGKLLGRLYQVLLLTLVGLPMLCFLGVFGGLDGGMLLAFLGQTLLVAFGIGAASLLASVWARHTRDAVLALYALGVAGFIVVFLLPHSRLAGWLSGFNPVAGLQPGNQARQLVASALAWGSVGLVCLLLAVWRLQPAYLRQLEGRGRKKHRWWQVVRLSVVGDPLRWKERHVEGIAPLAVLRQVPCWLGIVLVVLATLFFSIRILLNHLPAPITTNQFWARVARLEIAAVADALVHLRSAEEAFYQQGLAVMVLASFIVGIRCSGAVTGEREKRTWEALLMTPLETRRLVRGKLWGIVGAGFPYLAAYGITAAPLAMLGGLAALFWTIVWLAVTLMGMCYLGAAGLWASARCQSSWRSLLMTLGLGYIGGFVLLALPTMLVALVMRGILHSALAMVASFAQNALGVDLGRLPEPSDVATCIAIAAAFCVMTEILIVSAEKWVGRERTKDWDRVPHYVRLGRRLPVRY
jgi:ABC-type transport system involved in multi-copper enzyme maturation permease subunit